MTFGRIPHRYCWFESTISLELDITSFKAHWGQEGSPTFQLYNHVYPWTWSWICPSIVDLCFVYRGFAITPSGSQ